MNKRDKSSDAHVIRNLHPSSLIESRHFLQQARDLGMTEDELLGAIRAMLADRTMRRYGAVVRHRSIGYTSNVLVAWNVPNERIEEFSSVIDSLNEVSHGYERARYPQWNYNVYTMIHGHSESECLEIVERIASTLGLSDYTLLFTRRELKKCTLDVPALLAVTK
ncbi:MAG: siroheme decarboxylase subunit beta [Halobacteriota archaeon]